MKIIICLNKTEVIEEELKNWIADGLSKFGISGSIVVYRSIEELFFDLVDIAPGDLYFLDTEYMTWSGIDVGRRIHNLCPKSKIVFYAENDKYAIEGYKIPVYRYILLHDSEGVYETFQAVVEELQNNNALEKQDDSVLIEYGNKGGIIHLNQIIYIQKEGQYCKIHYYNEGKVEIIKIRETMKNWEKILPHSRFSRIEQGYIVNLGYVNHREGNKLYMQNGETLFFSRRYLKKYKEALKGG